jgi:hypothetical protein
MIPAILLRPSIRISTHLKSNEDRNDLSHPAKALHVQRSKARGVANSLPEADEVFRPEGTFTQVHLAHSAVGGTQHLQHL